jgi:hypothetical protein
LRYVHFPILSQVAVAAEFHPSSLTDVPSLVQYLVEGARRADASDHDDAGATMDRIGLAIRKLIEARSPLLTPAAAVYLGAKLPRALAWVAAGLENRADEPESAADPSAVQTARETRLERVGRWVAVGSKASVWFTWLFGTLGAILFALPGGPLFGLIAMVIALVGGQLLAGAMKHRAAPWKFAASFVAGLFWGYASVNGLLETGDWAFGSFSVLMFLGAAVSGGLYLSAPEKAGRTEKGGLEASEVPAWYEGIDPEIVAEVEEAAHLEVAIQRLRVAEPKGADIPIEEDDTADRVSRVK